MGIGESGFDLEVLKWGLERGRRCGGSNLAIIVKMSFFLTSVAMHLPFKNEKNTSLPDNTHESDSQS